MAKLNIITNNTEYVTFDFYSQINGALSFTFDIPKINVTSISADYTTKIEDALGVVIIVTITQMEQFSKDNGLVQLIPSKWALSTDPTNAIADAATLRADLLTYFKSKW